MTLLFYMYVTYFHVYFLFITVQLIGFIYELLQPSPHKQEGAHYLFNTLFLINTPKGTFITVKSKYSIDCNVDTPVTNTLILIIIIER